jgi:TRAP-type C4-dicarboxylate transport system permease small subunit
MNDWPLYFGVPLWGWLFVAPTLLALACALFPAPMGALLRPLWRILDRLYLAGGLVGAFFLMLILAIIVAQMIARWSSIAFPGSTEFAGYAMAATSFLSFAYALNRGAHIRVSILLNISPFTRIWVDAFALLIASVTASYFARYAIKTNFISRLLNDRTQGQDMVPEWVLSLFAMFRTSPAGWGDLWAGTGGDLVYTPMWLPQLPMSVGTVLLATALWDNLTRLMVNRESRIKGEAVE